MFSYLQTIYSSLQCAQIIKADILPFNVYSTVCIVMLKVHIVPLITPSIHTVTKLHILPLSVHAVITVHTVLLKVHIQCNSMFIFMFVHSLLCLKFTLRA